MKSTATAVWTGAFKDGNGLLSGETKTFTNLPYTFARRFEGSGAGTTPEELIAAAHAGCFAMATSVELTKAGHAPSKLTATAVVTIDNVDGKQTVTSSALTLIGVVPGLDAAKFTEIANGAKAGCPISRLLNAKISLDAKLETAGVGA